MRTFKYLKSRLGSIMSLSLMVIIVLLQVSCRQGNTLAIVSENRDGEKIKKIEELVGMYSDYGNFNGSILVANEGEVLYKKGFGWAVMAKTHDKTDGGNGWFWYEVTDPKDSDKLAAIGNGVEGCFSCHGIGKDMVRSTFPLK